MMAQAIMIYLTIITDYGFNLSATKEIAKNRDDLNKVSEIFCSVFIIKTTLLVISFSILIGIVELIPLFKTHALLFYFSFNYYCVGK